MTFKVKDGLSVGANTILDASGNLTVPGKTTLSNTTTTAASLNLGTGTADPTTPSTGDVWNNSGVLKIRQSAATKTIAYTDSTITGNAANVTGTVAIANGGTNGTATPTAGAVAYGTGTAFGFTAAGTSGQYLASSGSGVPVWTTFPTASTSASTISITDDTTTATAQYLHFGSLTTGNDSVKVSSSKLTFVPSSGNITTTGSVTVGGNGVVFGGSTSGTTNVKASAIAGTTTITLPATTGTVVTTGDSGTVTGTMIAGTTITNSNISATAAIAVSKLAASTISGITLGSNLATLTISTGLTGTSYNGSAATSIALAASGVTAGSYGTSTSIPAITVDTYGRVTAASVNSITVGAGTLTAAAGSAGATNTTVALSFDGTFDANSTVNRTISPVVGPAITALAATMTGATTGVLSKTAADTYSLVTNISTASTLQTARNIQGVSFNGSADITVVTAGTGVSVAGTAVSIGQAVATSSDVRFNSIGVGVAAPATPGALTASATISAAQFSAPTVTVTGAAPVINFYETDQTLPAGRVRLIYDAATFQLQRNTAVAGDFSTSVTDLSISSAGAITGSSFNSITGLSLTATAPLVAGTATGGISTLVAREDHVHPVQTSVSGNAGGLSATLVATSGGTGQSSYAVGDILYASTTTALSKLADVATGNALISGGVATAPSWGKIGLTTHVSGQLGITNGGTGATTASAAVTNLGGTTVGSSFFTLANPTAITFPRINADNTVSALDAATFRTAIGAGTSSTTGTVTSVSGTAPISVATGTTTPAISISAATTAAAGSMSAADKTKLDGIATGATANTGTVTSVSVTTNNGISGTVSTSTTTPAISLSIGALTGATSITMNGSTSGSVQLIPTAVAGTGTVLTLPATSGTVALTSQLGSTSNFGSQTAATFLAAPNAAAGNPTFRAIVAADIPTLNQSTTGNAGTVTNGVYTNATNTFTGTNAFNGTTIHTFGNVVSTYTGYFQLGGRGIRKTTTGSNIEVINNANTIITHTLSDNGDFTAAGNVTAYSDIRLKKDLVQISDAVNKVQQLTGYTYTRIDTGDRQTGLVAQDVQKVLPEAVMEGENLSVAYGNLVGLLVEAIKELKQEIEILKSK